MTGRTYRVVHRTVYHYGSTMSDGYTVACLVPRPTQYQSVRDATVELHPPASEWDSYIDVYGNFVNQFGLHQPHADMVVEATSLVEVHHRGPPQDDTPWDDAVSIAATALGDLAIDVGLFRSSSKLVDLDVLGDAVLALSRTIFTPGRPIVEAVTALCRHIFNEFEFDAEFSNVSTPLADVLDARRGVCQDFAHLAVACLRSVGLPARYVSGYIETVPPPGRERLVGADASHAWCSVWTPLAGWVDFDPTNDHLPVNDHVTVAWGRDYSDVIPVRGVMIGPATTQDLDVSVDVSRV
ncbi:MAG: transglutaminase family protein [Ilumatobacteraceae bacterium]